MVLYGGLLLGPTVTGFDIGSMYAENQMGTTLPDLARPQSWATITCLAGHGSLTSFYRR